MFKSNAVFLLALLAAWPVLAQDAQPQPDTKTDDAPSWYSLHAQGIYTLQGHPQFSSAIPDGPNSMKSHGQSASGTVATLFMGVKYDDLELYANPEMDQGFGVSDTVGTAGYVNGEAGKVGKLDPYFRLQRAFGRYTFNLGGESKSIDDAPNQVTTAHDENNVMLTFGKFSAVDIFDNNSYAHDPSADFLNWSIIDMGAFDYAADSWGYTYGGAVEWNQGNWTLRQGLFDMSRKPNDEYLQRGFGQYQTVTELEERHEILDAPGKIKALLFVSAADMGSYNDALALAQQTGSTPNTASVRHWQTRPGGGLNAEQQILPDLGAFARFSLNDGTKEAYEFTEINRSLSGGLSLKGTRWNREDDTFGLAGALNDISADARNYFAAGGQGILIGDGQLPSYAGEEIIEAYYKASIIKGVDMTGDYQRITNPAYDAVRGPINFYAVRLHLAY